ncbi:MAG: hypothetical protein ACKVRP_11090, partial [Bacteroidota bacterium]
MRTKLLMTMFLGIGVLPLQVIAQPSLCGTPSVGSTPCDIIKGPVPYVNATQLPFVDIGIAIHIVRDGNGGGGWEGAPQPAINAVNSFFAGARMRFFIVKIDMIDSDQFAEIPGTDGNPPKEDSLSRINVVENAINVYLVPVFNPCGKGTFTSDVLPYLGDGRIEQSIIVNNSCFGTSTFPHEVGHYFNLLHTFERLGCGNDVPPSNNCRASNPNLGDLVGATPPDPFPGTFWVNCQYDPGPSLYCPEASNLMSIAGTCRTNLYQEQLNRARTTYNTKRGELQKKWVGFTNRIGTANTGGSFLIDGMSQINSGDYYPFTGSASHTARTQNERFDGAQKHHDWNSVAANYLLSNSFSLPAEFTRDNKDANFIGLSPATLTTSLLDAASASGGTLQFNDLWFLNSDGTQGNNFGPQVNVPLNQNYGMTGAYNQSTGGVFLNQSGPPFWNPPYYSVGAPQVNTIGGFESYFVNWSGTNVQYQNASAMQTGVVFTSSGATATARYKGHLLSSVGTATASASQRKLVSVPGELMYMVYESTGEIWLTSSTSNGTTWDSEFRISDGAGGYNAASITTMPGLHGIDICVVYRRLIGAMYEIVARIRASGNWQSAQAISTPVSIPQALDPRPVVGSTARYGTERFIAMWNESGDTKQNQAEQFNGGWTWTGPWFLYGAGSKNLSLSNRHGSPASDLYLSLEYEGQIYGDIWDALALPISDDPTFVNNRNSSIAVDATGRVHVAWIAYDKSRGMDVVVHRGYTAGEGWSPFYVILDDFGSITNLQASVCAHDDPNNGGVSVFWSDGDIPFVFDNYSWDGYKFDGWKYSMFSGVSNYPNAGASVIPASSAFVVTQGTQSLYPVAFGSHDDSDGSWLSPSSPTRNRKSKLYRRTFFTDTTTNASLSLEFGDIILTGTHDTINDQVHFVDTRANLRGTFLRTETFRINESARAHLRFAADADLLPQTAFISLAVVDSATGDVIATLSTTQLSRSRKTSIKKNINEQLPVLNRAVYLDLR